MNSIFTSDEIELLDGLGVHPNEVYDARYQPVDRWQVHCRREGIPVIIGSRCAKGGHRIRTRSNHCIQCNPGAFGWQRRHHEPGWVYIAASAEGGITKVGSASDPEQRRLTLRKQSYGGFSDWRMIIAYQTETKGDIEHRVQKRLSRFATNGFYFKDGKRQQAKELFTCHHEAAAEVLLDEIEIWERKRFLCWSNKLRPKIFERCNYRPLG